MPAKDQQPSQGGRVLNETIAAAQKIERLVRSFKARNLLPSMANMPTYQLEIKVVERSLGNGLRVEVAFTSKRPLR